MALFDFDKWSRSQWLGHPKGNNWKGIRSGEHAEDGTPEHLYDDVLENGPHDCNSTEFESERQENRLTNSHREVPAWAEPVAAPVEEPAEPVKVVRKKAAKPEPAEEPVTEKVAEEASE